ncbi:hypothetical protein GGF46_002139 [Coemansia sp. RSA 552]|nr:hypothetical protein GGF46_002139 [Coemansia sp. RSA 552]
MARRNARLSKNWRLGMFVQLKLWTVEENQIFFTYLARSVGIMKGAGLKLNRGVLDMSALELIMKGLESNDYDWLLMEELDAEYPQGSWWEMVWHLADMHNKLGRHSMFEINFKMLRAIENILLPLNTLFLAQNVSPLYLEREGKYHPLSKAVDRYCGFGGEKDVDLKDLSFIDYFMQAMLAQHGMRMCSFLQVARENLRRMVEPPSPPLSDSDDNLIDYDNDDDDGLADAMNQLSLES